MEATKNAPWIHSSDVDRYVRMQKNKQGENCPLSNQTSLIITTRDKLRQKN